MLELLILFPVDYEVGGSAFDEKEISMLVTNLTTFVDSHLSFRLFFFVLFQLMLLFCFSVFLFLLLLGDLSLRILSVPPFLLFHLFLKLLLEFLDFRSKCCVDG
jgi:hypothetical protein